MSWLTEDPTLLLVIGGLLIAALIVACAKTGRVAMIAWAVVVAAVVGGGVLVEHLVVTPREEVEGTIEGVRQAFVANDQEAVLRSISPAADNVRRRIRWALRMAEIREARITDGPHIQVNNFTTPPSATAELIAVARGRVRTGTSVYDQYAARFLLRLVKHQDRWLIEEVKEEPPLGRR